MYHWFVRPRWFTKKHIHDLLALHFSFADRSVLDFGCGIGSNCRIAAPAAYLGIDPDVRRIEYASRLFPEYRFRRLENDKIPVNDHTIDYVLIVAVLHHIPTEVIRFYLREFRRILRSEGQIIAIEPFLANNTPVCNRLMKWFDRGQYIRDEQQYVELFQEQNFSCTVLKSFRKGFVYNELFFTAQTTT